MLSRVRITKLEIRGRKLENRFLRPVVFLFLTSNFLPLTSYSQCAMCRAAIESEGNVVKSEAINDGIVYLMIIPYLLVAGIGYAIYRMYKNKKG